MDKVSSSSSATTIDLSHYPFVKERKRILPYHFVKQRGALPLDEVNGELLVGVANALAFDVIEEVRHRTQKPVREIFAEQGALEQAIELCYHHGEDEASKYIQNLQTGDETVAIIDESEYDLLDQNEDSSVIRLLNVMLLEALQQGASDIHFEPVEEGLIVRYRIDGVMQMRHAPPRDLQRQLLTRIKVLAKLDIAEQRLPQDGRIKLRMGEREIDFRVSTVPIVFGERIVLRILDNSNILLGLDKIAMPDRLLENFRSHIRQNQGIVLVTGPTGSGKTTTLYSALSEVQSEEVNIMTCEDPVEYKLKGMAQIGINSKIGLSFARSLRHILRQDPDVIMIGEIRDRETAEIAIQAALTGHLVISTLHTNDAPSAITRLIDMGIEPYLLSSTLLAVLAQRLVRKICPHCKSSYTASERECDELSFDPDATLYVGAGCDECFGLGYRGREGIYELMSVTPNIRKQMINCSDASTFQQVASEDGMISMREYGARKALDGVTTSKEVLRVTKKESHGAVSV